MTRYVVVAPYVTVRTMTEQGPRIIGLYTGAPVPEDAPADWCERHADAGLIAEVEDPATAVVAPLTPMERMEAGDPNRVVAERVREGEAARNRARGSQKAAEAEPKVVQPVSQPAKSAGVKPEGK